MTKTNKEHRHENNDQQNHTFGTVGRQYICKGTNHILSYFSKSDVLCLCSFLQTREGFLDLLETTPDIDMFSHWEDIVPKMEPFEMGESIDLMRQIWFIQYKWEDVSILSQKLAYI